ncbi:MAG: tRNA (adenosine(37)-N6)-threonylcarbamoyltransferase complex ATPase subunit type 1 TsaE [Rhodospirillaceae bacterium]
MALVRSGASCLTAAKASPSVAAGCLGRYNGPCVNWSCGTPVSILRIETEKETLALGAALAKLAQSGDVITLSGPLGVGKTTLSRGFIIERIGSEIDVSSPTFTLSHVYDLTTPPVWHFDFYRIDTPEDVEELGLDEAQADGISLIEWPDRAAAWLPAERLDITMAAMTDSDARTATMSASPKWMSRMGELVAIHGDL